MYSCQHRRRVYSGLQDRIRIGHSKGWNLIYLSCCFCNKFTEINSRASFLSFVNIFKDSLSVFLAPVASPHTAWNSSKVARKGKVFFPKSMKTLLGIKRIKCYLELRKLSAANKYWNKFPRKILLNILLQTEREILYEGASVRNVNLYIWSDITNIFSYII